VYHGRILDVHLDRVRFPDGSESELEIIRHPGACAVLPMYRRGERRGGTGPRVVLLRQYRYAAGGVLWEVPAGKLDGGEQPRSCALRELEEETGLRAHELVPLGVILTTPGFTDERIHLFLALELTEGVAALEPDEFIETVELGFDDAITAIDKGEIVDAKTICTLLLARRKIESEPGLAGFAGNEMGFSGI